MRPLLASVVLAGWCGLVTAQDPGPTDLPAGKKLIDFTGHMWSARWSQDGKTVVTCTTRKPGGDPADLTHIRFKTAEVWDAATGKRLQSLGELEVPGYPFHYLSADGSRLVVSQQFRLGTGEMEVWDVPNVSLVRKIAVPRRPRPISCIVLAPKGDLVADIYEARDFADMGPGLGGFEVFNTATGGLVQTLREERSIPRTAVFTPDSRSLITRGSNDIIRLWDLKTGKAVREAQAPLESGFDLALSPDGKTLVIPAGGRAPLQLWAVPDLKARGNVPNPFATVMQVSFSPGGKRLLVSGYRDRFDGTAPPRFGILLWDLERNVRLHDWDTPSIRCGFCGEDHVGVGTNGEITAYPISPAAP